MLGNIVARAAVREVPPGLLESVPYCNTAMEREVEEMERGNCIRLSLLVAAQLVHIAMGIVLLVKDGPNEAAGCLAAGEIKFIWSFCLVSIVLSALSMAHMFFGEGVYQTREFTVCTTLAMSVFGAMALFVSTHGCIGAAIRDIGLCRYALATWILWVVWCVIGAVALDRYKSRKTDEHSNNMRTSINNAV